MSRTSRLPVWFQWIVVTSGCIGLDAFLLYGIDKLRSSLGCYDPIFVCNPVGWSLLGVEPFVLFGIIGLGQWLVLRRQIGRSTAWILVSAIISPVAIIAMLVIGWLLAGAIGKAPWAPPLLSGIVGGVIVGTVQFAFLHRRLRQAGWWIVASGIAWALGTVFLVAAFGSSSSVLQILSMCMFFSLPTGITMEFLLAEDNIKPQCRVQ